MYVCAYICVFICLCVHVCVQVRASVCVTYVCACVCMCGRLLVCVFSVAFLMCSMLQVCFVEFHIHKLSHRAFYFDASICINARS